MNKKFFNKESGRRGWYSFSGLSLLGEIAIGGTRQEIANRVGCSKRTVQRIINSLRDAGYDVRWDGTSYRIPDCDACIAILGRMSEKQISEWLKCGRTLLEDKCVA